MNLAGISKLQTFHISLMADQKRTFYII